MRLVAHTQKIAENARAIVGLCGERGVKLAAVTKCVCGEPAIARAILAGGITTLAESRLDNVRRLRDAGIEAEVMMMRLPLPAEADDTVRLCQISINTEEVTLRALSEAAVRQGKTGRGSTRATSIEPSSAPPDQAAPHQIVIMVEMGDRREGVMPDRAEQLCRLVTELPGLQLAGVGMNLNCLCGVLPTVGAQRRFAELAESLETKLGTSFRFVSAGHTNNVRFVLDGTMPARVNHLRVGEAILFGTDELSSIVLPVPHQDTFRAFAPVIEVQDKPSAPEGPLGMDAFNRVHEWPDRGVRRRAVLAMGEIDLSMADLSPARDDVSVVGASSDHAVIDVTDADPPVGVGDELEFACRYNAVSSGWSSTVCERVIAD